MCCILNCLTNNKIILKSIGHLPQKYEVSVADVFENIMGNGVFAHNQQMLNFSKFYIAILT